jgi:hypothetical protein
MDEVVRTYRFDMTITVEPGDSAYLDPEWAADAAAHALTDGYGIDASYNEVQPIDEEQRIAPSSLDADRRPRSYRFSIAFEVGPEHVAYDDPEWAADAAHGTLTNEYGLETTYSHPELLSQE